jgi:hypothetical protein
MKNIPLFICRFEGGHAASVAVFCALDALDPARGVMLARRAYAKLYRDAHGEHRKPPAIVRARFELNGGEVLATYDATALAELVVPVDDNPYGGTVPLPPVDTLTIESTRSDAPADDGFSYWLQDNPTPDLQAFVGRYGTYNKIPPTAWADFDRAKTSWEAKRKARLQHHSLADMPAVASPESSLLERCTACGAEAHFGYRVNGETRWFCADHRLAKWWADEQRGNCQKGTINDDNNIRQTESRSVQQVRQTGTGLPRGRSHRSF